MLNRHRECNCGEDIIISISYNLHISVEWVGGGGDYQYFIQSLGTLRSTTRQARQRGKLDDAVLIYSNKKSFLKFDNRNNHLKVILVTFKQFCLAKRCPVCYTMDFQNTCHVVAFIAVAQGTLSPFSTHVFRRRWLHEPKVK